MPTFVRTSTHLALPALLLASVLSAPAGGPALTGRPPADPAVDGVLQTIRVFSTSEHGVPRPSGMSWNARLDALVLSDAERPHVVRAVQPDETDLGRVPERLAPATSPPTGVVGLDGHDLRGRAVQPETGHTFTYDATTDDVLELSGSAVVRTYDASDLSVDDVRGIVIAPSADPTDHPSELSFYVVDNGAPGNFGEVVEATVASDLELVAAVSPLSVRTVQTSAFSPPSPDPSGVAYLPGIDRLYIADGEVDEMSIFRGANLFTTTRPGALTATGVSQPWSDEPVGVGYNALNNHLFVSDDDQKEVFELTEGPDGRFGTSDDNVTNFDVLSKGVSDPEGIDFDPATNSLWFAGGEAADLHRVQAGGDGRFGTSDDVWSHWDAGIYGAQDPEGMAFDTVRGTVLLLDDSSAKIYELDRNAALLNTIDISSVNAVAAAGLAVAPASDGSGARTYYMVARGEDNNSHPTENDGRLYEITASLPPIGGGPINQAPSVDAGTDRSVVQPAAANLDGTVSDDGLPANPGRVTTLWSVVSGPGDVTFGDATVVDTTAGFSAPGTYVLRLSANDGEATTADEVTVFAAPAGGAVATEARATAGADDAEQGVTSGATNIGSSDLELTTDGNTVQLVGVRFPNVQLPRNATVVRAYVQFWTDEVSTGASSLTINAEAADNAAPYAATSNNVGARATTPGSVAWAPPDWSTVGQGGAGQRTSDVSALVQAVVGRSGWSSGNALALRFSGTGRRTARAVEAGAATAPLLHVEYTTGTATNQAPVVNAGVDASVTLPSSAALDGTVSDDGLPASGTLTSTWSKVSGPGTVTFQNPAAQDTSASFSAAGTYVLRLTGDDGALSSSDDVTVQVLASGGVTTTFEKRVAAGSDDAEQAVTGSTELTSSDLELTTDGTRQQVVGTRFTGVTIPHGATISNAYVQFRVDEVSSGTSSMTVRAEAVDNAGTYVASSGNVSSRAVTTDAVPWTPPDWPTVGAATTAQRTPNLAALVQAVVNRPGWQAGNALALQFSGTGRRTAEAFEGGATFAPLLHVEYSGGTAGPVNQAPVVDAGPNRGVILPEAALLDGTVSDDGLPASGALTTTWAKVSGPGDVAFTNASSTDTTATFSVAGTYVLRLTASDGQLGASDDMTAVVQAAGGGGPQVVDLRVAAGSDDAEQSTRSGSTSLSSSDLELTTDGGTQQLVGIRIANVPVPAGATITNAYLQFTTDEVSTGASALTIRAETADNAPTYTSTTNAIGGRGTTTTGISWSPAGWTTVGQAGDAQRTPDLTALVQAVVARSGWVPGNAIAFQISGTGVRTARAFESGATVAPRLHIEYSTG